MFIPVARWLLDTWFYWVPATLTAWWALRETVDIFNEWDARSG